MNEPKLMSIGQVAKITGIHIKSLRYYDRIGVLKPAYTNPETGYRYYTMPQLYTLEAIQLCIELDIPLKEFSHFVDADHHLHYDVLLEHGQRIMQKRMESIRQSMEIMRESQREMAISEKHKHKQGVFTRDFQEMTVALCPVESIQEETQELLAMTDLYAQYQASGMKLGYAYGHLFDYHGKEVRRYSFVQIIHAPQRVPHDIRVLPGGKRACIWSHSSMIEDAQILHGKAFGASHGVTAVETELMSKDHDIHNPLIELSFIVA